MNFQKNAIDHPLESKKEEEEEEEEKEEENHAH